MPTDTDPIFGVCYLSQKDFAKRKAAFGAQMSTAGMSTEAEMSLLAMASRQIETYLGGRKFDGVAVTEHQPWNPRTRRFPLNNPPPSAISACTLWVAPALSQDIGITPVVNDGSGNPISWGQLLFNRQLMLMEIGLLASISMAQPVIVIAGVQHPFIEITYTPLATPPPEVVAACGYQAAALAQLAQADDTLPGGLTSVRTRDQSISRKSVPRTSTAGIELCPQAMTLLNGLQRLAVG